MVPSDSVYDNHPAVGHHLVGIWAFLETNLNQQLLGSMYHGE